MSYNYPTLVYNCRSAQLGCVIIQIFVLYSNADSLGTFTFVFSTALCLYNLYVIGKRWYNNIDGRFDMRQMVREPDSQLKVLYAAEVFTPAVVGLMVYLMVRFPGGNFLWALACCVQITAALILIFAEVYEVFVKGY
ncbi:hypothetical protein TELCIR_01253 [Teladorsagia circumcincta]|uniref:DUF7087 domain-containing protein n=1 Tax=Teladorsagia circumcincta TaxID=45464 RepID=A0A2G9V2C7_TELCI|nr:hypothetical protein TELCIR_01253 [Teladorsagia circumcincta]